MTVINFTEPIENQTIRTKVEGEVLDLVIISGTDDNVNLFSPTPHTVKSESIAGDEKFQLTFAFEFPLNVKTIGIRVTASEGREINILAVR